jgi:DNA polymerase-2
LSPKHRTVSSENTGFILTRNWRDGDRGVELEYWLSGPLGPHRLLLPGQEVVFFLPAAEAARAAALLAGDYRYEARPLQLKDFQLQPVVGLYFSSQRQLRQARDRLEGADIYPLEADVNPCERFLMERFIAGSLTWEASGGRTRVQPQTYAPNLKMVSVDIETAMEGVELFSIGVFGEHEGRREERVFMRGVGASLPYVETCSSERELLDAFCAWLVDYDPDVIIGWNVVNFDLWYLQRVAEKLNYRLVLGRGGAQAHWRDLDDDGDRKTVNIPGRVVLDGIEVLRTATFRFESFSLENVSREILGTGKLLHGDDRGTQIGELFEKDKDRLAAYNLRDCELVWEIFASAGLLEFAVARSQMTGLNMDRLGGSVAAFDYLYLPQLHRRGYVAPNASRELVGSPGGFVLDSQPGIFDHVLVLDFKSLYPSIIRTFRIDPLGLALGLAESEDNPRVIAGFQGGRFSREEHILPGIIEQLWARRDEAKARGDAAQSQAIKIIMNSFYGVLGTSGCRFFDARLASSITRRGHQIIQETRDYIESLGERVIYGDTDSVFVWLQDVASDAQAQERGEILQAQLNRWWTGRLEEEYQLDSVLELEFETHFHRFLMPTVRGSDKGSKKRYAGVVTRGGEPELVFKGLENVRTDWTLLARRFQSELYRRVFFNEPYLDYVKEVTAGVSSGEFDSELVYRKRLRRRLDDYQRNIPPHVQAARLSVERGAGSTRRGDWVEYVMTLQGAEPTADTRAALDYQHYLEKQLAPVADGILHFLNTSFAEITGAQISLF